MKKDYIESVTKLINNKSAKEQIALEISDHFQERIDYFMELGYTPEQAEEKAQEAMGKVEDYAVSLDTLHSAKLYKQKETYFALAFALVSFLIYLFFGNMFRYTDITFSIIHYITVDFVSLALCAFAVILIRVAKTKRNLAMLPLILIGVITRPFEPAMYAIAKICTSGFNGYIDSIFSYSYVKYDSCAELVFWLSFAFMVIIFCYCIWSFIKIWREQSGKNKGLFKTLKIFENVLICILALNFAVMSICAVIAYIQLPEKLRENDSLRRQETEFVLKIDMLKNSDQDIIEKGTVQISGWQKIEEYQQTAVEYGAMSDNIQLTFVITDNSWTYQDDVVSNETNNGSLSYGITTVNEPFALLNQSLYFDENTFKDYLKNLNYDEVDSELSGETSVKYDSYSLNLDCDDGDKAYAIRDYLKTTPKAKRACTLKKFINDDIYKDACLIVKNATDVGSANATESLSLWFALKNSKYKSVELSFTNSLLTNVMFYYK